MASELFCNHRLQRLDVEGLVPDQLLQPSVLVLQRPQATHLLHADPAKLGFPALQRLALVDELRRAGVSAEAASFDVTDRPGTETVVRALLAGGPIQIVVHAAGVHDDSLLAAVDEERWSRVIGVSLDGLFYVVRPLLMPMAARWGSIIVVTSGSGVRGNRGRANYAAAMAGIHGAASCSRSKSLRGGSP